MFYLGITDDSGIISGYGPSSTILAVGALLWRMNMTLRVDLIKLIHDSEMRLSNDIQGVNERVACLDPKREGDD